MDLFIEKSLEELKEKANLTILHRLQGYCLAKGYHFYMYNHCANNDYLINFIRIRDKKYYTIATASVDIHTRTKIDTETQYC
jgi:hypothetical protein